MTMMVKKRDSHSLITANGIEVSYRGRSVLSKVNVAVHEGEAVTLIGPNGAGKTTLVRVVLGLLRPDRGEVWRRPGLVVGYVPQRLTLDASLPMTVKRFLTLSAPRRGDRSIKGVARALHEVGAPDVIERSIHDLSGGELQRVLLARSLLRNPDLLVLDEPVQGVDVTGQAELYRLIAEVRSSRGCGVLIVSHDLHLVMATTDHVICLNNHICCAGHPEAVSQDPAFTSLFGDAAAGAFAVYQHHHNHTHGLDGSADG